MGLLQVRNEQLSLGVIKLKVRQQWCKNRTQGYNGVEVTNFTKSWADGLALCALVHSYNSSAIAFNTLNPEDKLKNCTLAIDVAEQVRRSQSE